MMSRDTYLNLLNNELVALLVTGNDTTSFLQGQTTNDISKLNIHDWQYSAHLNHKGRMLAVFIIYKTDDGYLLITHRSITDSIIARLKMFILRSKVKISILDKNIWFIYNSVQFEACGFDDYLIRFNQQQCLLITNSDTKQLIQIDDRLDIVDNNHSWHQYLIANKIVFITNKLVGKFIPQHLEFQAVSYEKGCYTGQEIVARTHYLGKSKKSLLTVDSDRLYDIGDDYTHDNQSAIVLDSYYNTADNKYIYLIVQ